jgi:deazaflavin-dependent oxidoreductase (nitroreductase family)
MPPFSKTSRKVLQIIHKPPQIAYAIGLGPLLGKFVLLLTTTGRKSGLPRITPLQYEYIDGKYYLGAALGLQADWVKNIQNNPKVQIQVKSKRIAGQAEVISDVVQIVDFLAYRYEKHPRMLAAMLRQEGISIPPTRAELETYAGELVLVIVHPQE